MNVKVREVKKPEASLTKIKMIFTKLTALPLFSLLAN